jgi:hypothetical protein
MYFSTEECGELLGFKPRLIKEWCKKGLLKSSTIPSQRPRHYVRQMDLIDFAQKNKLAEQTLERIRSVKEESVW